MNIGALKSSHIDSYDAVFRNKANNDTRANRYVSSINQWTTGAPETNVMDKLVHGTRAARIPLLRHLHSTSPPP